MVVWLETLWALLMAALMAELMELMKADQLVDLKGFVKVPW